MEKRNIYGTTSCKTPRTSIFFFDWERVIYKSFSGLFNKTKKEENKELASVSIEKRWGWLAMVDRLSNGDITKHDEVYLRNYIECLNILSYWHERDKYHEQQNQIRNSYGK